MDWRTVRFDWNRARAFLVTAEEGSFSAAARALGLSQPTVGRQVAALEEALGVVLFARTGTALELTEAGLAVAEHARAMGAAATRLSLAASGTSEALEGDVCVTASELIAAFLLPPVVAGLRRDHPGIRLEIVAANDVRDLLRREADIAVRNVAPTEPDLVGRRLGARRARMYATPEYLARIGPVTGPADLSGADFFAFDHSDLMVEGVRPLGLELTRANFPMISGSHLVQWELCKRGLGIGFFMEDVGDPAPEVVRVLPSLPTLPVPIWLVSHRELRTSRRIRVVFDRLAEVLAGDGP